MKWFSNNLFSENKCVFYFRTYTTGNVNFILKIQFKLIIVDVGVCVCVISILFINIHT